jgi:hypothetical protein
LLPLLLKVIREVDPELELVWDARDAISIKVASIGKSWGRVRTKEPDALDVRFLGKPGQLNLSRLEGIGQSPTLTADRADGGEAMRLVFQRPEEMPSAKLKEVLRAHLGGFRERFGSGKTAR